MPAGNNNFVDTDAKIKDFLNAVLSSEGIVVDIRRTFINYNGVNRSRVFARRANEMASKGGNEKFVVIALMCYPALQWILQAQDIDRLVEELREQNPDESVSRMSNIQRVLESSLGGCKPQLRLEMRKVFFARCQQLVDAVDEAMNAVVFHNPKSKAGKISLAMALLRGSILETDPVTAVTIRTHFDSIIEDVAAMAGDTIKPLVMELAPNEGNAESSEAAFLFHNTEVLLKEYSRIANPSSVDENRSLRIVAKGNRLFCPVCYNQNRRNAAQRSNARTKVQREQMKREEEKMKQNNCAVTSAAGLNMRAKLADMGGMSYGELSMWEKTHGLEFAAWEHEWEKLNSGTASDGLKFPDHLPEGFPTRKAPPAHSWSAAAERAHEKHNV